MTRAIVESYPIGLSRPVTIVSPHRSPYALGPTGRPSRCGADLRRAPAPARASNMRVPRRSRTGVERVSPATRGRRVERLEQHLDTSATCEILRRFIAQISRQASTPGDARRRRPAQDRWGAEGADCRGTSPVARPVPTRRRARAALVRGHEPRRERTDRRRSQRRLRTSRRVASSLK